MPNVSLCKDAPTVMHYTPVPDPYNGHDYVDLGLPSGTKWATMNVGASSPEGYGDYFAWGEIEEKDSYTWKNYKLTKGGTSTSSGSIYKYNKTDGKKILDSEDDAASVNMGGEWHMPTKEQTSELLNTSYVTLSWETNYQGSGHNGLLITSIADNSKTLFLPASGYKDTTNLNQEGNHSSLWTKDLKVDSAIGVIRAFNIECYQGSGIAHGELSNMNRSQGRNIRGVVG